MAQCFADDFPAGIGGTLFQVRNRELEVIEKADRCNHPAENVLACHNRRHIIFYGQGESAVVVGAACADHPEYAVVDADIGTVNRQGRDWKLDAAHCDKDPEDVILVGLNAAAVIRFGAFERVGAIDQGDGHILASRNRAGRTPVGIIYISVLRVAGIAQILNVSIGGYILPVDKAAAAAAVVGVAAAVITAAAARVTAAAAAAAVAAKFTAAAAAVTITAGIDIRTCSAVTAGDAAHFAVFGGRSVIVAGRQVAAAGAAIPGIIAGLAAVAAGPAVI